MTSPATLGQTVASAGAYYALDRAYRAALAQTSLLVAQALGILWGEVDPTNLAGSAPAFLPDAVEAVVGGQRRATSATDAYARLVRQLSVPDAPLWTPPPVKPPNREQIRSSIEFLAFKETGQKIGAVEQSVAEEPDVESAQRTLTGRRKQLVDEAIARIVGGATRLTTAAAEQRMEDVVRSDRSAIGWARTTKPGCCYFCAMLASRGAVYEEDSFEMSNRLFANGAIPSDQKVHDSCGCGLRPVYTREDPMPERQDVYEAIWIDSGAKASGPAAVRAFRRAYEAHPVSRPAEEGDTTEQ